MKTTFRIILLIIVAFFTFAAIRSCSSDGISQSQYNALKIGMPFESVEKAMGFEGKELLFTEALAVYEWRIGGSVVKCTFTNGFLSGMSADGLKNRP